MGAAAASNVLIVAGSVSIVEALKDQGFARWNYTLRSIPQLAKSSLRSVSQANKQLSSPASAMVSNRLEDERERAKQSEESLREVIYLSCWALN